jgi:hypothetical protein
MIQCPYFLAYAPDDYAAGWLACYFGFELEACLEQGMSRRNVESNCRAGYESCRDEREDSAETCDRSTLELLSGLRVRLVCPGYVLDQNETAQSIRDNVTKETPDQHP